MSQNQEGVQVSIETANKLIAQGEAMTRLLNNADFAEVIGEVFYKEEAARLAGLLGDIGGSRRWVPDTQAMSLPPTQFVKMQADIIADIQAIGSFQAFVRTVLWKAEGARNAIEELEAMASAPLDVGDDADNAFPEA